MQTEGFSIYGTSCFARERRKASLSNGTRGGNGGGDGVFHTLTHSHTNVWNTRMAAATAKQHTTWHIVTARWIERAEWVVLRRAGVSVYFWFVFVEWWKLNPDDGGEIIVIWARLLTWFWLKNVKQSSRPMISSKGLWLIHFVYFLFDFDEISRVLDIILNKYLVLIINKMFMMS